MGPFGLQKYSFFLSLQTLSLVLQVLQLMQVLQVLQVSAGKTYRTAKLAEPQNRRTAELKSHPPNPLQRGNIKNTSPCRKPHTASRLPQTAYRKPHAANRLPHTDYFV